MADFNRTHCFAASGLALHAILLKVLRQPQCNPVRGAAIVEETEMESDRCQYRGFEIRLRQEWSNWCANIIPLRDDLPMLTMSPLRTLSPTPDEALAAAKQNIDEYVGSEPEQRVA